LALDKAMPQDVLEKNSGQPVRWRKLHMLTVVDCCSRESLGIHIRQSLKSDDVVRVS
jgi:hypothetical protein